MKAKTKLTKLWSFLLSLVMLLSLLPGMELHAHAFWDDYDDGFDCPNCDHYHFGSDYMCDCLFCTIDCNYECWVETHCNDCGVCFGDTPYWCEECYKCAECMEEKHCSTCAKCYIGEDDQLCGECHKGPCCSITICDTCGFCDDCANDDSDPMHCSLCNACFGSVDECVDDDDTGVVHCIDCHTACEQCEECLLNQESCEECGLCLECCRDNSEDGGCPDGETCVESAEWDEHICPGCDGWVTNKEDEDEFCETCELCKECCEGNSDCSEGMCAMDTDYADHFCEDCGLCFHDSDPCEDDCDQRCKDCCRAAVSAMGCNHDDQCFSDSDFENHLNAEHPGAEHTHTASATWSADGTQHWHPCRYCDGQKLAAANHEYDAKGVCKVCGYISGSAIVITRQPRGVKCKTSIYDDYQEEQENGLLFSENNWVTFSVSAKSLQRDELTYQWYQKDNARPTAAPYKLPETDYYVDVNTPTLRLSVSAEACMDDFSYFCVIGRKGDASDTLKTAEAKLTATHAYSYQQAGVPVPTDDSERTPEYKVTWVDTNGVTHNGGVGGDPKCDGHKLPCLFEESALYEAHYMTSGSKERIFPHTFELEKSYDAVGGGRVDMLVCTVCDYPLYVKSHVHDYGWNWDCTGFGSIYEYTFNIGGSTKTVEQLILESGYAHPEKCKVPGCEEFIMVPHSWGYWHVAANPDNAGGEGGMAAECGVCEYFKSTIDGDWTKDTALVTVKNGRATRMIVKPGDKIRLYPEEKSGKKAIGWTVEYLREYNEYDIISGTGLPVTKNWDADDAKTLFKLVTNGSALEWGCTIPAFRNMGAPGGGQFFFEPVYAACDHSGGTTVLNAKPQVCDRKGYTGDTACADCGYIISAGSDTYPPANAGHTGPLQPLYYYGTTNSATTDKTQSGKRYNASTGDCRHRAYEGDYRCTACGGTVKGETGEFRHSGPFAWRDGRAATCTEKGYSGNQYCVKCDKIVQKGVSTPSLHEIAGNYQLINEVKPTCTAAGYSGDYQCKGDCKQIFRYGHVLDKLGHDWNSGVTATQGNSKGVCYTCQRVGCGETKFVKGAELPNYVGAVKLTVTAPTLGEEPKTEVTSDNGTESHFSVQSVSWKPVDTAFAPYVNYTVSVALEAEDGYTFAGNSCKINDENAALKIDSADKTAATAEYTFAALSDAEAEKYQLVLWYCSAWYMDGDVKVESVEEDFYVPAGATVHLVADSSFQEDGFCRWVRVDDTDDTALILNSRSLTDATLVMPAEYREVGPENHEFIPTQNACKDTENPAALVRPATCTEEGVYYLSCSHTGCDAVDYNQTFTTPAPGHEFDGAWLMDGDNHWQRCQRCFNKESAHDPHAYDSTSETPNTCTTCGYQQPEAGAAPCGHENKELVNEKAPTCLDKGYTGDTVCADCGVLVEAGTIIDAGGHQFGGEYEEYTKDPEHYHGKRCTNPGCDLWYALEPHDFRQPTVSSVPECYLCGYQKADGEIVHYFVTFLSDGEFCYKLQTVEGGVLSYVPKAPQKSGYRFLGWYLADGTEVTTSTVFGSDATATAKWKKIHSTGTAVSATTYPITIEDSKNGDVTASHKSAAKGTTITLTVDPDKGYVLDTLTVLDGKDKEIKLTEKNGKYTFTMPASKVTVEAMFKAAGNNPFIDVPAGSYYEDAVIWAVDKGITTGTGATTFNPNGICTRAQAVTFLWRAAGSPAPKSSEMPFEDVAAGSYYYDAVLWAVENGITDGTSDTTFSPDATCSRAQIVTFLWRSQGVPAAGAVNPFTDVAADAYYNTAVLWAAENGITGGTSATTFSPATNCTRAQIVTFLYRYFVK